MTCKASKGIWPEDLCLGSTVFNNCDIIHNTDCRFLRSSCLCSFILVCQRLLYFFLAFICSLSCERESSMFPLLRTLKDRQMRILGSLWLCIFYLCSQLPISSAFWFSWNIRDRIQPRPFRMELDWRVPCMLGDECLSLVWRAFKFSWQ